MKRREFIGLFAATAAGWPVASLAQQAGRTYRVGLLTGGTEQANSVYFAAFARSLRELGYVEGQNIIFTSRYADGNFERLPSLVQELLGTDPDVLLVSTTPANLAAKAATSTKPIVMVGVGDPLRVGLVQSLARPGGNITGVTNISAELAGKRLELLKKIVPDVNKVAVLVNPDDAIAPLQMDRASAVAKELNIELDPVLHVRGAADLEPAFQAAVHARAGAALRMVDPVESALRAQTVALAAKYRLPIMFPWREAVQIGGLTAYGPSQIAQFRQAAVFVQKILNGQRPADLPVEQPTKFEWTVNVKTANALGVALPPTLLALIDEVIE
jgi:putative ABC transport system substrate-binding protein